jgi:hypothetical protein
MMMRSTDDVIPGWQRAELSRALKACESNAMISFYSHFRPILSERAGFFGIPDAECSDAVETFLGDLLLRFCTTLELPDDLHAYVFVSFRREAAKIARKLHAQAEAQLGYSGSEGVSPLSPALVRFSEALTADLTRDEERILDAKREEMPIREIASLLGTNYNAANTRIFRLRAKLRAKAAQVILTLAPQDRAVVERFLRRAGGDKPIQPSRSPSDTGRDTRRIQNG